MTTTEEIRDIFSILHDGDIVAWSGDNALLTLTIECLYLAERIDKSFDRFYVELGQIRKIELDPWTNPPHLPAVTKTDLADIFKAELEITSANIKGEIVVISCYQHDTSFDYSGGNLSINCQKIKVFDQNRTEISLDGFKENAQSYWDEWSKK